MNEKLKDSVLIRSFLQPTWVNKKERIRVHKSLLCTLLNKPRRQRSSPFYRQAERGIPLNPGFTHGLLDSKTQGYSS